MKLEDLEAKLGIANMGEEEKLALVKDIQANLPALKAEQRTLEAKTQANLVVEAIKKIKEGLEARFDELNGIVDAKVRDITSGKDGKDGKDGKNGVDGKDGKDGISITGPKGEDGKDGEDGVGVKDAHIDFDGSLIITLTDGKELNVGEVVPFDVAEKIKVIGNGGGTSQSVLDTLTSLQDQINILTGIDGTLGTMAQQDDTAVDINGGAIDNTVIGGTTPAAGTFTTLTATGQTSLGGAAGSDVFRVLKDNTFAGTTVVGFTAPQFSFIPPQSGFGAAVIGVGLNPRINSLGTDGIYFATNQSVGFAGTVQAKVSHTASAVNYVQVTGAATNNRPVISAQGSDTNIAAALQSKGTGLIYLQNANGGAGFAASAPIGASANYYQATAAAAGAAPVLSTQGSDTNISQVFQSKGTGAIDLAAGSSGVNISNGGTVTALTVTASGGSYTSIPTPAITAPTTAGGVQAVATATMLVGSGSTVGSGGTGYAVNDTLTIVGGTFTTAATFTVTAVSGGVVTAVTNNAGGTYSVLPTNPVSTTGGTGTGCTINITSWGVRGLTITNAGSGYVEQPTVSFSGGGGSGAAAYATVGSAVTLKSIGGTLDLQTTNGIGFRIYDSGGTIPSSGYWAASSGTSSPFLWARGGTNTQGLITSSGTGSVAIQTNSGSQTQFNVAHTASAVNYVQVTGSATLTGAPTISAQGSDFNIPLRLQPKGVGAVELGNSAGWAGLAVTTVNNPNWVTISGKALGSAPVIGVSGADTNIDLALTTKGTGAVNLNTGGGLQVKITDTASAVNYLSMSGAIAANYPVINAVGNDTNVGLILRAKGTPAGPGFRIENNGGGNVCAAVQMSVSSPVNYPYLQPAATGSAPSFTANGSDANIDLALTPKGTGRVKFGTYTANMALTIQGYIEIVDSGGTVRKLAVIA